MKYCRTFVVPTTMVMSLSTPPLPLDGTGLIIHPIFNCSSMRKQEMYVWKLVRFPSFISASFSVSKDHIVTIRLETVRWRKAHVSGIRASTLHKRIYDSKFGFLEEVGNKCYLDGVAVLFNGMGSR